MTHTRLDIEPGGVSELGHKSLTVESMTAFCCSWVWFGFVFLHTGELQVSVLREVLVGGYGSGRLDGLG